MIKKLLKRFTKPSPAPEVKPNVAKSAAPKVCKYCQLVCSAGRSGERTVKFPSGDSTKIEIINESGIEGRRAFSLNIFVDAEYGWYDMPITHCPFCGKELKKKC